MHAILSDPRAMRFWSTMPHETLAQSEAWFESLLRPANSMHDEFVIVLGEVVIGKIGIWQMPEMGFILHPDHWGRGYASEAAAAFVRYVFKAHPIAALPADIDPGNAASHGVLSKIGFVETGRAARTFNVGGAWSDSVYLGLRRGRLKPL